MQFEAVTVTLMDAAGHEYAPCAILLGFVATMIDASANGAALPYLVL